MAMAGIPMQVPSSAITKDDIEKKPWKYIGYRGFSSFLASDNDFLFLRRFGTLHARVLLELQDQVVRLEEQLDEIDSKVSSKAYPDQHNGSFRTDAHQFQDRSELVVEIQAKLREYDEMVPRHSQIRSQPQVPARNIESVSNWLYNAENAIADEETAYLTHTSDLFPLVPKPKSSLRKLLECSSIFRLSRFWRTKPSRSDPDVFEYLEQHIHYSSDDKIERFVSITILILGVIMLIAPLWILAFVHGTIDRLGIITLFIVLFLVLLSFTTVAKPFESLTATAAYSAVLMVFLQIAGN